MAVSTTFHSPSLTLTRAALHHHNDHRLLNITNVLSFAFNLSQLKVKATPATFTLQHSPLPLQVLCKRGNKGKTQEKIDKPDPIYRNRLVSMVVNRVLKNGKKSLAYYIIYRALKRVQVKTGLNPLMVLRQAVMEVTPDVTVKSRRVGGSTQQVPVEVRATQGKALAIRWLLDASRKRQGKDLVYKLSSELLDAARGSGDAVRKKQKTHKMAEANRAFAHFR